MLFALTIMDHSQVILLTILLSFTFFPGRVRGGTSWGPTEGRGYDLQKGPVFYEAYYMDDQWPTSTDQRVSENMKTKAQQSNRANILENTYQTRGSSFHSDLNEENASETEERKMVNRPVEQIYENTGNREVYKGVRQLNKFTESLRQDIRENNYPTTDDSTDYVSMRGNDNEAKVDLANSYSQWETESLLKNGDLPDERFDNYMNVILSAIKSSALEILRERVKKVAESRDKTDDKMIILRHPRFVESEDSADRYLPEMKDFSENSLTRSSKQFDLGIRGSEIQDWTKKLYPLGESDRPINDLSKARDQYASQSSIPRRSITLMENILQPRPQIINYVFRPTNKLAKDRLFSMVMQPMRQIRASRLPPANDKKDNNNHADVNNDISKGVERLNEITPEVASIEVSEITRHKIRHHHGEKSRRNHHHRRQIAARR